MGHLNATIRLDFVTISILNLIRFGFILFIFDLILFTRDARKDFYLLLCNHIIKMKNKLF